MNMNLDSEILEQLKQKDRKQPDSVVSLEKGILDIRLEVDHKIDHQHYLEFSENSVHQNQRHVYQHSLDIDYQQILQELKGEWGWDQVVPEFVVDYQTLKKKVDNYELKQSMDVGKLDQIKSSLQSISELYVQDQIKMQAMNFPQYCFMNRFDQTTKTISNVVFDKVQNTDQQLQLQQKKTEKVGYDCYVEGLQKEMEGLLDFNEKENGFNAEEQMKKFTSFINCERLEKIKEKKNQEMNKNLLDIYLKQQEDHEKQKAMDKKEIQLQSYKKLQESKNQNIYEKFSKMDNDLNVDDFNKKLDKTKMAITYEFELDDFQKRSILRLEENKNVFVSAHTSAGKTVIAEYAIALSINKKRKVIYTSPIKALSNQKYRELRKRFKDVGIITGDIQVNSESSCLIMTTEILRNMLLKDNNNNEVIKQIEWVIFDEIHYLNDPDRGVVWEETIIMLPKHIKLVMLSATVPNAQEFAEWVGRTRQSPVYLHSTSFRPVPLQHNIYIQGVKDQIIKQTIKFGDQSFTLNSYMDRQKDISDYYKKAMNDKKNKKKELDQMKKERRELAKKTGHFKEKRGQKSFRCQINRIQQQKVNKRTEKTNPQNTQHMKEAKAFEQLLQDLKKNDDLPCIVFMFSKAKINQLSQNIMSIDLCSRQQSKQIGAFVDQCLKKKLKKEDIELPQFIMMKKLLVRGIGVHYGDLLPIMKEIVEILFSQSLIKVLLATETFAMGVNMPAKSVVFYQIQKNDGQTYRFLKSNEYIQMSGRAGRRGLDDKGKVVIFFSANPRTGQVQLPPGQDLKMMLDFKGEHLQSQFRIKYGLLLNLLNNNQTNDELKHTQLDHIMQNSFLQNQQYSELPKIALKIQKLSNQMDQIQLNIKDYELDENVKQEYLNSIASLLEISQDIVCEIEQIDYRFLNYRVCILMDQNSQLELGIITDCQTNKNKNNKNNNNKINNNNAGLVFDVLVEEYKERKEFQYLSEKKAIKTQAGSFKMVKVYDQNIIMFCDEVLKVDKSIQRKNISDVQLAKVLGDDIADIKDNNGLNDRAGIIKLLQSGQQDQKKNQKNKREQKKKHQQYQATRLRFKNQFPELQTEDQQQQIYLNTLINNQIFSKGDQKMLKLVQQENDMNRDIGQLRKEGQINNNHLLGQFEDKVKVLTELNYIDKQQMPQLKCRLGKELSECSIYVIEMILEGLLENLNASESAAFLSCFICCYKKKPNQNQDDMDEKMDEDYDLLSENLRDSLKKGYKILDRLFDLETKYKVTDKDYYDYEQEYFNIGHVRIVYEWCQKMEFVQITKLTDSPEGAIVRTILRLEQLIRNVKTAAKIVGNQQLQAKMEEAQQLIKRDIVFTQSLYLDD